MALKASGYTCAGAHLSGQGSGGGGGGEVARWEARRRGQRCRFGDARGGGQLETPATQCAEAHDVSAGGQHLCVRSLSKW